MYTKPLWRWTIGEQVSELGWHTFVESIRLALKVYPEFDFVVCHNGLSPQSLERFKKFPVFLLEQKPEMSCFNYQKKFFYKDYGWKIIPARLRLQTHELWVDNDIVIRDRIPDIDDWLTKRTGIISKGFDSQYGRFKPFIKQNVDCCAGFFGLPPHFDFEAHIKKVCGDEPLVDYDEQGLVAYTVSNLPGWMQVSYAHLRMWGHWQDEFGADLPEGIHFVGINRETSPIKSWRYYKVTTVP